MKVTLRQRLKGQSISLYLEYYHKGKRQYEYLSLFLYPDPEKGKLSKDHKNHNHENLALAENIRSKRHLEIQNRQYGFQDLGKLQGSFIAYIEHLMTKKASKGNFDNWDSMLKHLKAFRKGDIIFSQIDKRWVEDFKSYLENEAKTPAGKLLSQNTKCSYFNKLRAALKEATKEGIILRNPSEHVEGIKPGDTQRQILTFDELQKMADSDCEIPILKTAFLFSSLTGLRWSDVAKMTWSEVQNSKELGNYVRYRQKKTNSTETLPISESALKLLGERGASEDKVFVGLKYSAWYNIKLQQWAHRAGISKTITFHCSRHTYATLLLTFGADIFTVMKMTGHKHIKTTQIYAKIADAKKVEAGNLLNLKLE